ncbi:uncharacterized protein LOC110973210 isoform X2 [Acanthaster planci]|uniref:Uncharacterized protein LOC110973210 isoform X2 n=1 Tax=Acanthaster planci TaxID=133434 RepID=A0A8B7XHG9_ACAPL|nr:uncharacterized protein LOC110973210 isoform X2 [Acanthaster planci]
MRSFTETPWHSQSHLLLVIACLSLLGNALGALSSCEKVDDCSCRIKGSGGKSDQEINIRSLGYSDKTKAPRFGFKLYKAPWEYAYNPCYPWSDGTPNCKSVIVCQRSYNKHDETFDVGDVTASWTNDATNYYVEYKHGEKTSIFTLKCDATAKIPTLSFLSQIENKYKFILTSECCCPGTCHTPTPTPTPPSRGSISVGSVICIVAAVLIVVYLIGGMFLMKFVKHAEGLEVIPNKDIWVNLPGYIKDGFLFVVTCGKHSA